MRSAVNKRRPDISRAPVVFFISGTKEDKWAAFDIGMCSQNIMLAAKLLGFDTRPIGLAKMVMETDGYGL